MATRPDGLHRVYVFSDSDCVNGVHRGAIVGGPAYAPRTSGPLDLPNAEDLRRAGRSSRTARRAPRSPSNDSGHDVGDGGRRFRLDPVRLRRRQACLAGCECRVRGAKVDLWDRDWKPGGRYYSVVVPVRSRPRTRRSSTARPSCRRTRARERSRTPDRAPCAFGKNSADAMPIPQAIGLSPAGRLLMGATSQTSFYGAPLVTWDAAPAAAAYDVEWSRKPDRWHAAGHIKTPATSALLPLTGGTWWYRVRGINPSLPGNTKMTWSRKVRIQIAKPTYRVVGH